MLKTDEVPRARTICANVMDTGTLGHRSGLRLRRRRRSCRPPGAASPPTAYLRGRPSHRPHRLCQLWSGFDKQGSGRGDTWTMDCDRRRRPRPEQLQLRPVAVDYSSVNALELDGTQLTAMGGESDQYGSQGVFAGEEIICQERRHRHRHRRTGQQLL
ncbi:MAG: hypothetical protein ACLU38_05575 [Dysosmobacter sp.]